MIEVRSAYLVKTQDIREATALWQEARDRIWGELGWGGRIQQMLHGHAQQSLFVWSAPWENLAAWEQGMAATLDSSAYQAWAKEMNKVRLYGEERETFTVLEPAADMDVTPSRIEVRSSYLVPVHKVAQARDLMRNSQETVWPVLGWSGQNQQMLQGKASQSMFVWSSTWPSLGEWEAAMKQTLSCEPFQAWYPKWMQTTDLGGPREIFRNL